MRSFHNDSQAIIKNTEETNINIKQQKKNEKHQQVLPDIKVNIIFDENQKYKNNDSDDSGLDYDNKQNIMTYMKLPQIYKNEANKNIKNAGSNYFNSNDYKNQMKHNLSNQSLEIQINTVYPKNNNNKNTKKVNCLKYIF